VIEKCHWAVFEVPESQQAAVVQRGALHAALSGVTASAAGSLAAAAVGLFRNFKKENSKISLK
jgi:hypothetical protein